MKKIMLLSLVSLVVVIPQLHSISLAEYIEQNGVPQIQNNKLNLSNKNLTDLTGLQDIPNINQVINLDLSNNQLQTLPATIFNGLDNLMFLSLSNNQLQAQTLPADIFNGLNNLLALSLRGNQLQTLPDEIFSGLNNLRALSLDNNQLKTLSVTIFNGLNKLETLELRGNPFNSDFILTLADMIRSIPRLYALDGMPKDEALKLYRTYDPKTLKESAAEYIAKNIDRYRARLAELPEELQEEVQSLLAD